MVIPNPNLRKSNKIYIAEIETTGSTTFIERGLHGDDELGDGDVKAIELKADATAKNRHPLKNEYCWVIRFKGEKIVEVWA